MKHSSDIDAISMHKLQFGCSCDSEMWLVEYKSGGDDLLKITPVATPLVEVSAFEYSFVTQKFY